jgi:hypothetical protein
VQLLADKSVDRSCLVQIFRVQISKAAISALSIGARVVQGNELAPFDNEGFQDVEGLLERTIV